MTQPPSKKKALLALLDRGVTMIHLDARKDGVQVPPQHRDEPHLRLNLSYRYGIHDLDINDAHVRATLSFGGRGFQCRIPWDAVFAVTSQASGEGQVWPEDLPEEITAPPRPRLTPVEGPQKPQQESGEAAPKRGHLRLVR